MKKATVIISFYDLAEKVERKQGDTFTCEDERAEYLVKCGLVWAKDAPKKASRKKK